ncbi:MAG TPA: hypothetical protein VGJ22_04355 [Anaerolineales bacterium]|jgi:hypothetical protein
MNPGHPIKSQGKPNLRAILAIAVLSLSLAYAMFHESLRSRWSMVDDPEIAYFLGSDGHVGLREAGHMLIHDTEVGQYGSFTRYRPAYFGFRLLESWLWNDELVFWYLTNIVIFAAFITTFWFLASRAIGLVTAGLLTFAMATAIYWIDVFGRLGPSEPYVALGLVVFALGAYLAYRPNPGIGLAWFLISLGTMICTGSKENLFVILILLTGIAWDRRRQFRLDFWPRLWLGAAIAWSLWISGAIALGVLGTGQDYYHQTVGLSQRGLELALAIKRPDVISLFFLLVAFLLAGFAFRKNFRRLADLSWFVAAGLTFLWFTYLTQFVIYGGDFPNGDRYDVPGMLVWPLAAALVLWYLQQMTRVDRFESLHLPVVALCALLAAALAFSQIGGIETAQAKTRKYVKENEKFTRNVEKLAGILEQNPHDVFVMQVNNPVLDFAPVFAYDHFLRYYGVRNPIALLWAGGAPAQYDPLGASIAATFSDISLHGASVLPDSPVRPVDFAPLAEVEAQACVLLLLSSDAPERDCHLVYDLP